MSALCVPFVPDATPNANENARVPSDGATLVAEQPKIFRAYVNRGTRGSLSGLYNDQTRGPRLLWYPCSEITLAVK